jgi:hypothetical protein
MNEEEKRKINVNEKLWKEREVFKYTAAQGNEELGDTELARPSGGVNKKHGWSVSTSSLSSLLLNQFSLESATPPFPPRFHSAPRFENLATMRPQLSELYQMSPSRWKIDEMNKQNSLLTQSAMSPVMSDIQTCLPASYVA